jgi:hypothetical protein
MMRRARRAVTEGGLQDRPERKSKIVCADFRRRAPIFFTEVEPAAVDLFHAGAASRPIFVRRLGGSAPRPARPHITPCVLVLRSNPAMLDRIAQLGQGCF